MTEIENFKDPDVSEVIKDMRYSILPEQLIKSDASFSRAVGMPANQWGIKKRI